MPELPEVQAHVERLDQWFTGRTLTRFSALNFTVLKTADPRPDTAVGQQVRRVARRGKYLLIDMGPITFVVHLMQGGRLIVDEALKPTPRNGLARFEFGDAPALLLTEAGRERKAGVWCLHTEALTGPPLDRLGPDALEATPESLAAAFARTNMRIHGFLRDQHQIAGLGRMLANEVCHRARVSPFAMTGSLGTAGADVVCDAIHAAIADALEYERTRTDMSSSADRPGRVHGRVGHPCPECHDTIRSVTYSNYTVAYCPTCQTGGVLLADNTTSKFLK